MRTLWTIYTKILIGVILAVLIGAGGVNYYTKTQSDAKYYAKTQADTTFVKVADLVTPTEFDTLNITAKATVPTMAVGTNTNDAVNMATLQDELGISTRAIRDLKALGWVGKVLPAGVLPGYVTANETMVSGRLRLSTFVVEQTTTITELKFLVVTAGDYTASNENGFALYSLSGNTWTLIASSKTLNANIWKSSGLNTVSFASPQILQPGVQYKLAYMYSSSAQVTAPILSVWGSVAYGTSYQSIFANSDCFQFRTEGQTAFPASFTTSGLSTVGNAATMWFN